MSGAQQPVNQVDAVRLQNITSAYSHGEVPKGSLAAKASAAADYNMNLSQGEKPIMTGELKESGPPMLQREGRGNSQNQFSSQHGQQSQSAGREQGGGQSSSQQFSQGNQPNIFSQSGQYQQQQGSHETPIFSQGEQPRFPLSQPAGNQQQQQQQQQQQSSSQPDIHKVRQEQFSQKIEHLKEAHQLPEGMQPITKADAQSFVQNQSPVYANEDTERSLNAKVVMSAMINEVKQGGHAFQDQEKGNQQEEENRQGQDKDQDQNHQRGSKEVRQG